MPGYFSKDCSAKLPTMRFRKAVEDIYYPNRRPPHYNDHDFSYQPFFWRISSLILLKELFNGTLLFSSIEEQIEFLQWVGSLWKSEFFFCFLTPGLACCVTPIKRFPCLCHRCSISYLCAMQSEIHKSCKAG